MLKINKMKLNTAFYIKLILLSFLIYIPVIGNAQVLLEADGPGNTYELINSVLAPTGGDVVENPECVHPQFGRHIAEVWDADLNQYVFEFYIHVTPDNDRCINFDRQRVEIKTYDASPANLKGVSGETVVYKWRFKVPTGFQPSSSFTHIHQVKAVGGDEADPLFTLTARKGSPNKLELNYYSDSNLSSTKLTSVNLSLFENTWVEATERIQIDNVNGTYSITIKKVSDGATILSYTNNKLLTIRADNNFIRPKWGIYRSLLNSQDLRDESLRFNNISIYEEPSTDVNSMFSPVENEFKVIPDISNKTLKVEYNLLERGNIGINIMNISGQFVQLISKNESCNSGYNQKLIDISNLKSGIYFIQLQTSFSERTIKCIL